MKIETAMIAGIVASDGHLDKDFHIVRIVTSSEAFLKFTKTALEKITKNKIRVYVSKSGFGKQRYTIYLNDESLYNLLFEKFNIPKGKKSSLIEPPKNLDAKEEKAYIEGWFAGEGSITHDRNVPQFILWSKSDEIIHWLRDKLAEKNIGVTLFFSKKKQQHMIIVRRKDDFLRFIKEFNIIHPDKKLKLASLLERPRFRTS